jgi:hypothetical protein
MSINYDRSFFMVFTLLATEDRYNKFISFLWILDMFYSIIKGEVIDPFNPTTLRGTSHVNRDDPACNLRRRPAGD